jgi:sn-glycerol 3-phosphate transport system substrate-binding protein
MKRLILVILFLLAASSLFAKKIEITFWHSLGFHVKQIIDDMADEYNKNNRGVKINPVFQGLFEEMQVKMLTAAVARKLPDIAQVQIEYMEPYIENNMVKPINDIISDDLRNDIFQSMWDLTTRNGNVYGVPFLISTQVFYYNQEAFEDAGLDPDNPPATWEEMIEIGKKLTQDTDGDGEIDKYAMMFWFDGFYGLLPFLWANGGSLFSDNGKRIVLTSKEMISTVSRMKDLALIHRIMPRNWTNWEGGQAFLTGDLAMGFFTSAGIYYGEQNLPWTLRIAPMPAINSRRCTVLGGSAMMSFSKNRKKQKWVNDFVAWCVSKENTIRLHRQTGFIPVRKSALNSLEEKAFLKENPNYKVPIDAMQYGKPLPNHPEYLKLNDILREMIQRLMLNASDTYEELEWAEEKMNAVLE